jgi:hypothetical protein
MIGDKPRVWCRLLCELTAFYSGLLVSAPSLPNSNGSVPVIQAAAIASPFSSDDLAEESEVVWLSLTSTSATGTGASQVIRPASVVGTTSFGQPTLRVTPTDLPATA